MKDLEKKIKTAKKTANRNHACLIFSTFKIIKKIERVSLELPNLYDLYLKEIPSQDVVTLSNPNKVEYIRFNYRRGFKIDEKIVTLNYHGFSLKDFETIAVVADVSFAKQNNYKKDGEETLVLDVYKNEDQETEALFELKIGDSVGEIQIPNTKKFIRIVPLKK